VENSWKLFQEQGAFVGRMRVRQKCRDAVKGLRCMAK
jgi:hypothetical protein